MAQQSNIAIPARFVFRPYLAEWVTCSVRVVGWGKEPVALQDMTPTPLSLLAKMGKTGPSGESVIVRVALLSQDALAMLAGLYGASSYDEYEVEIKRTCVPPD